MFFMVEVFIVFIRQFALVFARDRDHAVNRFFFHIVVILGFVIVIFFFFVCVIFIWFAFCNHHFNRIAYEIGILFNDILQALFFKEFIIVVIFCVFFDMDDDFGSDLVFGSGFDGVAIRPIR